MLKQIDKIVLYVLMVMVATCNVDSVFAVISCSITTAAGCSSTIVLRMSSATNAHAELPWQSNAGYSSNVICCNGIAGTSCSGNFARVLKLSSSTNAHVEIGTNNNYATSSCISSGSDSPVIVYQDTNCNGQETTLASISSTTNATIGIPSAYTKKVCASLVPATISFSISTSTVYFGIASPASTRYASSTNPNGSGVDVNAHTFSVNTTAANGYTVVVRGQTLTSGTSTVSAIGAIAVAPAIGTEQFGIRLTSSGGTGAVSSPYDTTGFAYSGTATSVSQVSSASIGDGATTTYSVHYVANIAPTTVAATYVANIVYIATANF